MSYSSAVAALHSIPASSALSMLPASIPSKVTRRAAPLIANGGGVANKDYPLSHSKILGYGHPDYQEDDDVKTTTITARMNGKPTELASIVYQDENYIRIRDLADAQKDDKLTVAWDSKTKTVLIESK